MLWLLLVAALPVDTVGEPLPRYVTRQGVRAELQRLLPALEACAVKEDHTEPVVFWLQGDGTATNIEWAKESSDAQQCWDLAMTNHDFQEHDDEPVRVSTALYVRNGVTSLSPQVDVSERDLGPLMLFVLPPHLQTIEGQLHKVHEPSPEPEYTADDPGGGP